MRDISILIDKARIGNITIQLQEKKLPIISASLKLYAGQKELASYSISTETYIETDKIDVPPHIYNLIAGIEKILETIASRHCTASLKLLPVYTDVKDSDVPF